MADVKWIKIVTDIFDNRKIRQIESLPDGDAIIVIWMKLLCLAGDTNNHGMVYFTQDIPYTDQMLSNLFNRPLSTVQFALKMFEQFGMITIVDNILQISNWEKYQNIEGLDRIREQTRKRVERHREKKKLECNATCNVTVTQSNATEEDKEIEEDIDKEYILLDSKESNCQTEVRRCVEAWNSLAEYGIKPVSKISSKSKRGEMLIARIKEYGVEDVLKAIEKIKGSSFLQGKTKVSVQWFDFEWFVRPNNFPKVLEGKYDDSDKNTTDNESASPAGTRRKKVSELGVDEWQ